ncbi:hypothetical protein IE4872_PA00012 (plasmid) [Rhizobium gallicum]|uniref:Uncharacterized protein n=1 Tax=Rhizobium gallicum TaxID=56730 RepID=A0A1L5NPD5_9HYPH|nr:hypothetical protein IE4872_PA00012 [Rhizobium gallicum]
MGKLLCHRSAFRLGSGSCWGSRCYLVHRSGALKFMQERATTSAMQTSPILFTSFGSALLVALRSGGIMLAASGRDALHAFPLHLKNRKVSVIAFGCVRNRLLRKRCKPSR